MGENVIGLWVYNWKKGEKRRKNNTILFNPTKKWTQLIRTPPFLKKFPT